MKITIHTDEVLIEQYEVPDLLASHNDQAVIEAAAGRTPLSASRVRGRQRLESRGDVGLEDVAARLITARGEFDAATEAAKAAIEDAIEGGVSEAELGRRLGVDRATIRRWRGKA